MDISTNDLHAKLDPERAVLTSLSCDNHELLVASEGYLAVEDRVADSFHFLPEQQIPTLFDEQAGTLTQVDESADLILIQQWKSVDNHVQWSVELETNRAQLREIHLHFVVPVFGAKSHGFTANASCPLLPERKQDRLKVVYGPNMWDEENFHCSVLPMLSSYDPDKDTGLTIIQPPDIAKPRMEFYFVRECPHLSMVVRWTHLRLSKDRPARAQMLLCPTKGCWRDSLRIMRDRYPDYFRVHSNSIYKHYGPMICAEPLDNKTLETLVSQQKLAWQELHANTFPYYGNYCPTETGWSNWVDEADVSRFDLPKLSRTGFRSLYGLPKSSSKSTRHSRSSFNDYIELLHKKDIGAYVYVNPVACSVDHQDDFHDSRSLNANGDPSYLDYYRTVPMNPADGMSWAKQLDRICDQTLEQSPELDGFFLDELHYNQFDHNHDDGISATLDQPVSMLGFAVQQAARRICTKAHNANKAVWANGANTFESAHHVDGLMAEVSWEWLASMCYLAIEKPIVLLLPNNITSGQLQEALNVSLYVGAYPSVINNVLLPQEHALLLSNYRPLFELLRERKWLLMPHAITVDEPACMANCFVLKDGRYAISLISQPDTAIELKSADGYIISQTINKNASSEKIPLHLALPELANFSKWTLYQSNAHEHTAKTFTLHNTEIIRVDIDDPKNGVLITFE